LSQNKIINQFCLQSPSLVNQISAFPSWGLGKRRVLKRPLLPAFSEASPLLGKEGAWGWSCIEILTLAKLQFL